MRADEQNQHWVHSRSCRPAQIKKDSINLKPKPNNLPIMFPLPVAKYPVSAALVKYRISILAILVPNRVWFLDFLHSSLKLGTLSQKKLCFSLLSIGSWTKALHGAFNIVSISLDEVTNYMAAPIKDKLLNGVPNFWSADHKEGRANSRFCSSVVRGSCETDRTLPPNVFRKYVPPGNNLHIILLW